MSNNASVNYKVANTVDVYENTCTLNQIAANPGGTTTLWIDSGTGHLNRGPVDIETITPTFTSGTFVPTFTAAETTPNTYTNILSMYTKNGSIVSVWSYYSILANATALGSVSVTVPFASGSILSPAFAANALITTTGAAVTTIHIGNILAINTTTALRVNTSANLTSGTTYGCILNYSYVT